MTVTAYPATCWIIEGELSVADGSRLELKMTLREKPSLEEFLSLREGTEVALAQQTGSDVVTNSVHLSRANGRDWW